MNLKRIRENYEFLKQDYNRSNPRAVQDKFIALRKLEADLGYSFSSKQDFNNRMKRFFKTHEHTGRDLKNARILEGLTQKELAGELKITRQYLSNMELEKKPLSNTALKWLMNATQNKGGKGIIASYAF